MTTYTVLGIDCSKWKDDNSTPQQMDFFKAKAEGASFVFIKASQSTWLDSDFIYNWQAAKDAGLMRGACDSDDANLLRNYIRALEARLADYEHGCLYWGGGDTLTWGGNSVPENTFQLVAEKHE